jgi:hypothetical protein
MTTATAKAQRTPTLPWYVDYTDGTIRGTDGRIVLFLPGALAETPEVPEIIVRACNSHDALVAALRAVQCSGELRTARMTEIVGAALAAAEQS